MIRVVLSPLFGGQRQQVTSPIGRPEIWERARANVNARHHNGWTALMVAANQGHRGMVEALLNHGANARVQAEDGQTASTIAAKKGYTAIVQLLQAKGTP